MAEGETKMRRSGVVVERSADAFLSEFTVIDWRTSMMCTDVGLPIDSHLDSRDTIQADRLCKLRLASIQSTQ
ncbi:hypothetical protein [Alicyclobacillus sp. ALC3]|uniref:hypothetical protein n=1 Tax=Alicyclobacillus sp. ALC3 TaxID=2796143 RepID=UPI0023780329|nr:hypothetical protein [Alicyclobacillus sp. ALC3]WDL95374.1 hypothetical protein JC200_13230 [Alicyclobacillus sp. ALC3]